MNKEKNVFLTTIGETRNRLDIDYYEYQSSGGYPVFTTGVSVAEAGIKYMLSTARLDEIIVLGPPSGVRSNEMQKTDIMDVSLDNLSDVDTISEYGFLNYRIAEYLNQLDIELVDVGENLSDEEKKEALGLIYSFISHHTPNTGAKFLFLQLCSDKELAARFQEDVLRGCRKQVEKWLKYYLFSQMDPGCKMHILPENHVTSTRYVPIETDGVITIESINRVVRETLSEQGRDINLYMDIQGLGTTDGNTLISTFLLLNKRIGYSCKVCGLISSHKNPEDFTGGIRNVLKSYEIQNLIAGLDLFLEYGKITPLKRWWKALEIENADAERLVKGMDYIDEGISVCNVDLIAHGINVIREVILNPLTAPEDRNIFMEIVINAIREDFGGMLEGDELAVPELIKWSHKKKLYQQTLTIIESKVPEDIVKRGIYYYARNYADIKKTMKAFNSLYWKEEAKMRYSYNDVDHYFIKFYGRFALDYRKKPDSEAVASSYARLRVDALNGKSRKIQRAYSQLEDENLLYELLYSYYRISDLRNQVNHAIVDKAALKEEEGTGRKDVRDELDTAIDSFIRLYTRACEETHKEKDPYILDPERMKDYTRRHRLSSPAK